MIQPHGPPHGPQHIIGIVALEGVAAAAARTARELLTVSRHPRHIVCVCDELWRDGVTYEPWTEHYRRGLAEICRALAAEFDAVAELAADCVRVWKGELPDA